MRTDAHATRARPSTLLWIVAVAAFGLTACGGSVAPRTAATVNACAAPAAGLATLVCNLGKAHTYQDLAAYADPNFVNQGYPSFSAFVTRDPITFLPTPTTLTLNTPATGTYNKKSAGIAKEYLYAFNLPAQATVKVSLDTGNLGLNLKPFPAQQFSTQGAKIFSQTTGAYYADLLQGTYNPATGGDSYVLTLPADTYVVAVGDCPSGCIGPAPADYFTLVVSTTTAAPNLLFPGATPVGVQSLLKAPTTDQYYIAFAFSPLSLTGSPVTMTTGPFGIPVAKAELTGDWLLYGDQQAPFSAVATELTVTSLPAATTPQQVFVDVHGPGASTGTISVSTKLQIGALGTTTSLAPVNSLVINLAALSGFDFDWTNVGTMTFTGTGYDAQITVQVGVNSQLVTLPTSAPPAGGTLTLSCVSLLTLACNSSVATLSWSGWSPAPSPGLGIIQDISGIGVTGPAGTGDGTVSASGSISATNPLGGAPSVILGQRLQSEQSGDNVILQASKAAGYTGPAISGSPTPPLPFSL